jgi:hypothetical protein
MQVYWKENRCRLERGSEGDRCNRGKMGGQTGKWKGKRKYSLSFPSIVLSPSMAAEFVHLSVHHIMLSF